MVGSLRGRSWVMLFAVPLVAVGLMACGGGKSKTSDATVGATTQASASSTDVSGTWVVVQDSDGTKPKAGTTVTLVLDKGALTVHAVSPDDELTDAGTYSVKDGKMTIVFTEQQISATDQAYSRDGDTLTLPVKMFSDGAGSSTWMRTGDAEAIASPSDAAGGTDDTSATTGVSSGLDANWDAVDLNKYATAAAIKTFADGVNSGGLTWEAAVKAAVEKAKTFPDVTSVTLSPNGLNAVIAYKDGRDEELITESFSVSPDGEENSSIGLPTSSAHLVSLDGTGFSTDAASAIRKPKTSCLAIPSNPQGIAKYKGRNFTEPGREGLKPGKGLFGVAGYNANVQPKPITSDDSPPTSARRALMFAPLYDVPHPGPIYDKNDNPAVGTWSGFRETTGNNIECISADLKRGGYAIDPILGRIVKGKEVDTGVEAIVGLAKKLTANQYGIIYLLTHGAELDATRIRIEMGTLGEDEQQKIAGNHKITHGEFVSLEDAIRTKILTDAGLPLDDKWKLTIRASWNVLGRLELWVSSEFFRLLRTEKGVDFSDTLVFANACSSAANGGLRSAFDAKVFFGWDRPPDLVFASWASQEIFDVLPDKGRTARNAWITWVRHEKWIELLAARERPARTKVEGLKAYGKSGVEYAHPTDNSVILIYRMRHGPLSAGSDITKSIGFVKSCSDRFWSLGKKPGTADPGCTNIGFTTAVPTTDDVDDAIFDVGGGGAQPFGRWTLAD